MSLKLPVVSGPQLVKAFGKIGYYVRAQKGSHVHLRHPIKPPLTVPNHKEKKLRAVHSGLLYGGLDYLFMNLSCS